MQPDKLTASGSLCSLLPGRCCKLSPSSMQYVSFLVPQHKKTDACVQGWHQPHKSELPEIGAACCSLFDCSSVNDCIRKQKKRYAIFLLYIARYVQTYHSQTNKDGAPEGGIRGDFAVVNSPQDIINPFHLVRDRSTLKRVLNVS